MKKMEDNTGKRTKPYKIHGGKWTGRSE